jgi:protocatechuate 4,5-dioxygenase, alpha chain
MQAYHLKEVSAMHEHPPTYSDIPGTFVFDSRQSRKGYRLNMFCMSLNEAANRDAFRADEAGYLADRGLSPEQTDAVLNRQWIRMLELGGNVYYTSKLAACDGMSFQQLAAKQTGMSEADYVSMMVAGGRSIEGNRSRSDAPWVTNSESKAEPAAASATESTNG